MTKPPHNPADDESRRSFIAKAVYVSPLILTLKADPSYASSGSGHRVKEAGGNNGLGNGEDAQPPGNPPINDGPGTGPGNPGRRQGPRR